MRVSVEKGDPAYRLPTDLARVRVFLDDIEQHKCLTADDEIGEIKRIARDEQGRLIFEGAHAKRETVRGKVRIEVAE